MSLSVIEITNLSKFYGKARWIENVNLEIGDGYLSPFKFVNVDAINPAYKLEIWNLLYFAGISLILIGISFRLYSRKDIYT